MKKLLLALFAASAIGCTSVEFAVVEGKEIAANGEAVGVLQVSAVGLTALFHIVTLVESDLDTVVNRLLVTEAKARGGDRVEIKSVQTTPRHGIFALTGGLLSPTFSRATGVVVK